MGLSPIKPVRSCLQTKGGGGGGGGVVPDSFSYFSIKNDYVADSQKPVSRRRFF